MRSPLVFCFKTKIYILTVSKPRIGGGGGGLAVVYRQSLHIELSAFHDVTSFEYLAFKITGHSPLLIILVYHLPKMIYNTIYLYCFSLPSAEYILNVYDESISTTLNQYAPLKSRYVPSSCTSPQFNTEFREMKTKGWHLESFYKKTGLIVHSLAYTEHIQQYREALKAVRSAIGITGTAFVWFSSYLTGRQQFVTRSTNQG